MEANLEICPAKWHIQHTDCEQGPRGLCNTSAQPQVCNCAKHFAQGCYFKDSFPKQKFRMERKELASQGRLSTGISSEQAPWHRPGTGPCFRGTVRSGAQDDKSGRDSLAFSASSHVGDP